MKKAILLDVYGTLISTGDGSVNAVRKILEKNGIYHISPESFYSQWKRLHKQIMQQPFRTEGEIFALGLEEMYRRHRINGSSGEDVQFMLDSRYGRQAFPETAPVLQALGEKYQLILATNTDRGPLMENLECSGLSFDKIFTSEDLMVYKPDPRFYREILEKTEFRPSEVLFVGDSGKEDVIGPSQLGIDSILVDRKGRGEDFGQCRSVRDLSGLLDFL